MKSVLRATMGKNWETIKKFPITETFQSLKEIEINNNRLLAIIHRNITEQYFRLDVMNLDNNKFDSIYVWRYKNTKIDWNKHGVCIESDINVVYISFQDTLFYTTDLFDRNKWHYQLLPNNGNILKPTNEEIW